MNNDGVLRGNNVIKLTSEQSVLKLNIGDRIRLSAAHGCCLTMAMPAAATSTPYETRR
jgi:hypothetical protein